MIEAAGLLMMVFGGVFALCNIIFAIRESRMNKRLFNDACQEKNNELFS